MSQIAGGHLSKLTAFATEPGGGNPAGVWIGDRLPDAGVMQQIAIDVGFSETAFLAGSDEGRWTTRYYSPEAEVSFCGHATIASGVALVAHLVSPLTFQRPDDAARCVLVLDERVKCACVLRPCEQRPWLAEMRDRTHAIDH